MTGEAGAVNGAITGGAVAASCAWLGYLHCFEMIALRMHGGSRTGGRALSTGTVNNVRQECADAEE